MDALARDVSFLGRVLGEVLREQGGEDLFRAVEDLRHACRHMRHHHCDAALREIRARVAALPPALAGEVVRAFTIYFHLINMAEENHRLRRLAEREVARWPQPRQDSIAEAIEALHAAGASTVEVHDLLTALSVRPVFTAHPTEARRMTLLRHLRAIAALVAGLGDETLAPSTRERLTADLYARVTVLWQTNELRLRPQTVMDEVANGLWYFDHSVVDVAAAIHADLREALERWYPALASETYSVLEFGSWIGGDRDGNPNVTPESTRDTLRAQRALILSKYLAVLTRLHDQLSPSTALVGVSDALQAMLADPGDAAETAVEREDEPYRAAIMRIIDRVRATRGDADAAGRWVYAGPAELEGDLETIRGSLEAHRGARVARDGLTDLIHQVRTFGFHLARLDIRQHRERHLAVLDHLFARHLDGPFSALDEPRRRELLTAAIRGEIRLDPATLEGEAREVLRVFEVVAEMQAEIGPEAVNTYIVSMTTAASDLLAVLLFARLTGLCDLENRRSTLSVVPLFETEADLAAAPAIMGDLWEDHLYRSHLQLWGNRQTVMIGYSDSDKDAGYVTSNWMLYGAQRRLTEVAAGHGVRLTFFHGRGGAIGRGGGPLARAIVGQPAGTVRGRLQVTEQGEVLFTRYASQGIAHRHLEQVVNAVIRASSRLTTDPGDESGWGRTMDRLSGRAVAAYRELVNDDPAFVRFFEEGTPLRSITRLRIASRPSRRQAGSLRLADLRAIPWVFAWTQARYGVPGWYGLGSALTEMIAAGRLAELRAMYRGWPFFRWLLDAAQISLGKADLTIAREYAALVGDAGARERFGRLIEDEYDRTCRSVNVVLDQERLLDSWPVLQRSIELRNPYVDPMSFIQARAIREVRRETEDQVVETLRAIIDRAVTGIAAGLQNTG